MRVAALTRYVYFVIDPFLDVSWFDAAPLIAITATKEPNYGNETLG